MSHHVRIFLPDGTHADAPIAEQLTLGRAGDNGYVVDDEKASSKHAVIEITRSGKVQLRDLGSTNGTRVNGSPTSGAVLQPGDVVEIGAHKLVLWSGGQPPAAPARMDSQHAWHLLPKDGGPEWIAPPRATVGRSSDRDLTIDHDTVSAQHAVLTATADGLTVEDGGSSNGTWVDGTRVRRSTLKHGQVLAFGEIAFVVQHGTRDVAALSNLRKRKVALIVVTIGLVVGGGVVALKYMQQHQGGPPPAPAPAPSPAPPTSAGSNQPGVLQTARGLLRMGEDGSIDVTLDGRRLVQGCALVILSEDGGVRGRQGERDGLPENAVVVEVSGRTATGYVWTGPTEGYPFLLRASVTPRGAPALDGSLGKDGAPVIGGIRFNVPAAVGIAWVEGPAGRESGARNVSVTEATEIALGNPDRPYIIRLAQAWSVRTVQSSSGAWWVLVWRRSQTRLPFEMALGGLSTRAEIELAALRARAERAFDAREFKTSLAAYRELLGKLPADDPDVPQLREQMRAVEEAIRASGG